MKRIQFKDPTFQLALTTDVEKNISVYEMRWGYFDGNKPDYVVLGKDSFAAKNKSPNDRAYKEEIDAWFDQWNAARALVEACGGQILNGFKPTRFEIDQNIAAKKADELKRAKEIEDYRKSGGTTPDYEHPEAKDVKAAGKLA